MAPEAAQPKHQAKGKASLRAIPLAACAITSYGAAIFFSAARGRLVTVTELQFALIALFLGGPLLVASFLMILKKRTLTFRFR